MNYFMEKCKADTHSYFDYDGITYYEGSNHGIWLCNFVIGPHAVNTIDKLLKLCYDKNSVVLYSNNNRSSSKSKHIDIKFLVVERIWSHQMSIEHIETNSKIVDPQNKCVSSKLFHVLTAQIGVTL